jgi:molybdenum-dependent DNA-binding transcriptional regulator ModE
MESTDMGLLVSLDALLQEGSVTGAARRVGLSTPAMSHALARIRERLGDPILVRSGRGMLLEPAEKPAVGSRSVRPCPPLSLVNSPVMTQKSPPPRPTPTCS